MVSRARSSPHIRERMSSTDCRRRPAGAMLHERLQRSAEKARAAVFCRLEKLRPNQIIAPVLGYEQLKTAPVPAREGKRQGIGQECKQG